MQAPVPGSPPPPGRSAGGWAGLAFSALVVAAMAAICRPLLPLLAHLAGEHLFLFATAAVPLLLVFGVLGRDYGIHRLFWHEYPRRRLVAAFSLTLLIVNFVAVTYYTAIRPEDRIALRHLRQGMDGLARVFESLFGIGLLGLASRFDGQTVPDFQSERFGRFLVFLLVAVPPPVVVVSLPAFLPSLVRLSRRSLPPQRRLAHIAAWLGGVALGLSVGMLLVLIGNWFFRTLSSRGYLEGVEGRETREELLAVQRLVSDGTPRNIPDESSWRDFRGRLEGVCGYFDAHFDAKSARVHFEEQERILRAFTGERRIAFAIRDIERERTFTGRIASMVAALPRAGAERGSRAGERGEARPPSGEAASHRGDAPPPVPFAWSDQSRKDLTLIVAALKDVEAAVKQLHEEHTSGLIIRQATFAFLLVEVVFLLAVGLIPFIYDRVTSAFAICLVFSFMATTSAAFICLSPGDGAWTIAAIVAIVALVTLSNSNPFKFKLPGLERYYRAGSRKSLQSTLEITPAIDSPTNDDDALAAWSEGISEIAGARRKLVVVAVSGGATRSAIWTTLVLGEMCRRLPGFARHIRIISGASGGMVGAAYFVKALKEYRDHSGDRQFLEIRAENIESIINRDSLDAVAKRLVLRDAPSVLFPWAQKNDRGKALEGTWRWPEPWHGQRESTSGSARKDSGLMIPFSDLAEQELAGVIPSLIFSPMMVEDGRRLLISNLGLPFMTAAAAEAITDEDTFATYGDRLSTSAVELRTLIGDRARDEMLVSTAVRMNASFPYVSPAVKLPTEPTRRVVDAGYYDNYGICVAASWLYHHRDRLRELAPEGVLLVQIRDQVSRDSRLGAGAVRGSSIARRIFEAFSFLTSPPAGAESARVASSSFRNDEGLMILSDLLNKDDADFFTTVSFEAGADVAVSWALSDDEVDLLKSQLRPSIVEGRERNINVARLDRLVRWWTDGPPANSGGGR